MDIWKTFKFELKFRSNVQNLFKDVIYLKKEDRISYLLDILSSNPSIHIHKLQQLVDSSVSTLRRDLIELETNGIIKRSFGLVTLLRKDNIEYTASFRSTQHPNEKRKICRLASDLIFDNDSVFIDSSTTNKYIIQNLTDREKVNVITNNIYIAMQGHNQKNIRVFLAGGFLRPYSETVLGSEALEYLSQFHPRLSLISCSSINENGVFMADIRQTHCKKKMIENADLSVLLVDHSKFKVKSDFIKLCSLEDFDYLITDKKPDDKFVNLLKENKVKLIY